MREWQLAWRMARRELQGRFRGLRLLLVCLFLGVGTLAAIGSLSAAIDSELAARGRTVLGGDIELSASQRAATPEERAAMAELGAVSETVRMQAMAVREPSRGELQTVPIQLKAVDAAYPLFGQVRLTDGTFPRTLSPAEVWIAPALAERLEVKRGERLRLGGALFTIGGTIEEEPDRLGEGFTLGPVAIVSMRGIERTGLVRPGSLYESKYRVRLNRAADPQDRLDAFTERFPAGGWEGKTRERASPGTSRFIDRMGQFLILVGLGALAISGIGVGNGVSSYLAARRGSIAALKVLGATSGTIARIYVLQIAAVSLLGAAFGLAAGVAAVPLIVAVAGQLLPVAPSFAIYWQPLAVAAAYGLLTALAFTAPPLLRAGSVPAAGLLRGNLDTRPTTLRRLLPWPLAAAAGVLALALATAEQPLFTGWFLIAAAATVLLLAGFGWLLRRWAALLPRPRRPLMRLAIAALHRPGAKTVTLVVALGLGLTLFILLAAIRSSIDANVARTLPQRAPALFALDVPLDRADAFRAAVLNVEPGATIKTVPTLRGTITGYGDTRVADLESIPDDAWPLRGERGLTYSDIVPEGSELVAGRWWPPDYQGPPLVSVDAELAEVLDLKIGDAITYTLLGVERRATIASFRRINWDTLGFNFVLVFSPNAIADAPHNLAATIDLPPGRESAVMRTVLQSFPSVSIVEVGGVLTQLRDLVTQMATAIAVTASVTILAGIAVLIGAIAAAREARTYDSVILRTLGATRGQVLGAQALEYVILIVAVGGLALVLGLGGGWYVVTQVFEFEWLPDYAAVFATLAAGAAITIGIGLVGALPILNARPAKALREL